MPGLIQPAQAEDIDAVRAIFREYAAWVGNEICFESLERELAALPGQYAPPTGRLLLAFVDGDLAGCAALRQLEPDIGEMKRLYVRPRFQGQGLGRALAERVLTEARIAGYRLLRLDTLPQMQGALALYRSLGFREIPRYGDNPAAAFCFERNVEKLV